jgi:hypothetical protein
VLFGTNVTVIILGAALAFYATGVRGRLGASQRQRWVRWGVISLFAVSVLLAVVLALEPRQERTRQDLERQLAVLLVDPNTRLRSVRAFDDGVEILIEAEQPLDDALITTLLDEAVLAGGVPVRLETRLVQRKSPNHQ